MSILNDFILTDSTTREDLIARVNDLDEEIARLETKTEDMQCEIDGLSLTPQMLNRLIEAADVMADLGHIHNTPAAKASWAAGQ